MCGIAGLVGLTRPEGGRVEAMLDAMARRGPDGHGLQGWPQAVFGHRRLAILDLSERGRQPMVSPDGRVGLVFNGAIYNFLELRKELELAGRQFTSDTDTEVLLHGYLEWGIDALVPRLAGMFAFALWDDRAGELFLVRDRLGVKPLLWARQGASIAFASTLPALRRAGYGGGIDAQAVADYLEWGFVPEQRAIVSGIEKLPPATIARWREGTLTSRSYWAPPRASDASGISFPEAVDRTEQLLLQAVERRTRADVPIGALLSGGVDSALVCWALREVGSTVEAFTFAAPGHPEDESADALRTAAELGIPLRVLQPADGHGPSLRELVGAYGEPFAVGSALGMLELSAAARREVTVLLTGDGGDDVFLGYPHHRYLHRAARIAGMVPETAARLARHMGLEPPVRGPARKARNYAGYITGGLGAFLKVRDGLRFHARNGLLGPALEGVAATTQSLPFAPGSGRTILADYLAHALQHQFVAEYLVKVDGATMYHGLEARSPFLDHELWEFASALPYGVRLHGGRLKAVLREIARRRISERVGAGAKRGFEVPVQAWMAGPWRKEIDTLFADPAPGLSELLRPNAIRSLLARPGRPPLQAWSAIVLAAWLAGVDEESLAVDTDRLLHSRNTHPPASFGGIP